MTLKAVRSSGCDHYDSHLSKKDQFSLTWTWVSKTGHFVQIWRPLRVLTE